VTNGMIEVESLDMDVNGIDMMRRRRGRGGSGITSLRSAGAPAIAALYNRSSSYCPRRFDKNRVHRR
jgi:hypothetical protein